MFQMNISWGPTSNPGWKVQMNSVFIRNSSGLHTIVSHQIEGCINEKSSFSVTITSPAILEFFSTSHIHCALLPPKLCLHVHHHQSSVQKSNICSQKLFNSSQQPSNIRNCSSLFLNIYKSSRLKGITAHNGCVFRHYARVRSLG